MSFVRLAAAAGVLIAASTTLFSQAVVPDRELTLRIIVVETAAEAQVLSDQLRAGGNFVVLAGMASVDRTREAGGLIGRVALSSLRPELRGAVQGLGAGELSAVVRVPTGYAILKVVPDAEAEGAGLQSPGAALAATGSIKYALNVSGYTEAVASLTRAPKPEGWNEDPLAICRLRKESLGHAFEQVMAALQPDRARETPPFDLAQTHYLLGQLHAYEGHMAETIVQFEHAMALATLHAPDFVPVLEQSLGVAHLHKAEMDNGLYHEPGHRCLLLHRHAEPLQHTEDLEKAIEYFSRYLTRHPQEIEVRWLLNLSHMAAGSYPDGVPADQVIPRAAFESAEDVGLFVDVAPAAGIVSFAAAGGVIVDDFDNDGQFEIVTSTIDSCQSLSVFRRAADGLFVNETDRAGLSGQLGGLNILQADYDNDGCLDILVLRGAWEQPQRNSLLRNTCDGAFTDVTVAAGLATPVTSTQAAVWADVDNNGLLDLFIGNENTPAQLFIQTSPGTFEDRAAAAGVHRSAFSKGVSAGDYDNDGWVDLYVSNLGGDNFFYRNNGDGTFVEIGRGAGVTGPGNGFPVWFFDYDNDGWLDIFASSYYTSVEESARTYLGLPFNAHTMKLYRNLGDGSFQDVTRQTGLSKVFMPMGANFGDLDNDGFLDLYLGTGNPSYTTLLPSVLLRNQGGRAFVDVTQSSGTGELHKGHGVAFADLDGDGDQEIVFHVGGATPGDRHALRLFENPGHGADWIALKLIGTRSNRSAIGARITVTVDTTTGERRVMHRVVGSGGSFGASPLAAHVGLGTRVARVDVDVWWPATGTRQRFTGVGRNQMLRIVEGEDRYTPQARAPLPLGGATPRTSGSALAR